MFSVFKRFYQYLRLAKAFRHATKANDEFKRAKARRALMQQFADARGVAMKVGQLFAAANNPEDELSPLVKSIEALPLTAVLPQIEASLGKPWHKVFESIDESVAAASLGQVHHAVLKNGQHVAIKIRYPDIAKAVSAEMTLLGLMPAAGPVKAWHFDLEGYKHELKQNMDAELNYRHEAGAQQHFYQELDLPSVVVPYVHAELSSENMLVQSWEEGDYIDIASGWPQKQREEIATTLLRLLLTSLFKLRRLHGDPHLGNSYYRFNSLGELEMVLLDYGCTIELSEQESMALLRLIDALREKRSGSPLQMFVAMGFDLDKLSQIEPYLPRLCLYLFEPFLTDDRFNLAQWEVGKKIGDLLQENRWWFRSAGPARLIFIMRAFQGVVQQLELLQVSVNWSQVFEETIPEELLQKARDYPLPVIRRAGGKYEAVKALANKLKVRVVRDGEVKVEAELPAEAVLELDKFIPQDVQSKLQHSSKIDINEILNKVRESGIAAQQVIDFKENNDSYQVWLE